MAAGALLTFLLFGLVLWLAPAYLVYVHASNRNRDAVLWAVITLVAGVLGALLYLVLGGSTDRDSIGASPGRDAATVRCPSCGHHNDAAAEYCTDCGATVARECPQCGARTGPDDRYCADCGTALGTGGY